MSLAWSKFRRMELNLSALTNGELRVLVYLAIHCDPHNVHRTTYNQLAIGVGYTRRYTIKCAKGLVSKHQIETRGLPGKYVAIWLKVGFSHGAVEEPIPPPPDWHIQPTFPL